MTAREGRPKKPPRTTLSSAVARIATNTRRLRGVLGWTQEQAAEHCGIATQYLQLIEREGVNPTVGTLVRLANGLGVDLVELVTAADPLPPRKVGRPRKSSEPK